MRLPACPILICALLLGVFPGSYKLAANEVDQFTGRDLYESKLPDSLYRLNTLTNRLLDGAVQEWNHNFAPGGSRHRPMATSRSLHYMALFIHNAISREDRGNLPGEEEDIPEQVDVFRALWKSGRGPLQNLLEDPLSQGQFLLILRDNVYRDVYPASYNCSYILKIAGVLTGTDKIDHFFDQGYEYWRLSKDGSNPGRAIQYGIDSEWGWFGMGPAGVFSFADLRANWKGYEFYLNLNSLFRVNKFGRMEKYKNFDWRYWVDWQFDELLNPSSYSGSMYQILGDWMRRWEADLLAMKNSYSYQLTRERLRSQGVFDHQKWKRSSEYYNQNIPHDYLDLFERDLSSP